MIVFEGGIFFITDRSDIGVFNLKTSKFHTSETERLPSIGHQSARLVVSNVHLLIVYLIPPSYFQDRLFKK